MPGLRADPVMNSTHRHAELISKPTAITVGYAVQALQRDPTINKRVCVAPELERANNTLVSVVPVHMKDPTVNKHTSAHRRPYSKQTRVPTYPTINNPETRCAWERRPSLEQPAAESCGGVGGRTHRKNSHSAFAR